MLNLYEMFSNKDIKMMKDKLPYTYREEIHEKTNLSIVTIDRFFLLIKIRDRNAVKIFEAAMEVVKEHNYINTARLQKAKKIMSKEEQ